jgi:predicted phage-related endonuclease
MMRLPTVGDILDELDGIEAAPAAPVSVAPAIASRPGVKHFPGLVQGSEEWFAARRGLLTASEVKLILTPTLKIASNDKTRAHVFEIAAQRITAHVEPSYIGDDMLRGHDEEHHARALYAQHFAPVTECGFITNDRFGFTIGYSPDGLVGDDGLIECKSRRQKFQVETIAAGEVPNEFILQLQTGLLVSGREWIDFVSYSNGMPMAVMRVEPDEEVQGAILEAAEAFEAKVAETIAAYHNNLASIRSIPTERRIIREMF